MFDRICVNPSDIKGPEEKELNEFKDFLMGYFNQGENYEDLPRIVQEYKSQQTKAKELLLNCLNKIADTGNWKLARNIISEFGGRNPKDEEKLKCIVRTIIEGLSKKDT